MVRNGICFCGVAIYLSACSVPTACKGSSEITETVASSDILEEKNQKIKINCRPKISLKMLCQGEASSALEQDSGGKVQTGLPKHLCLCGGDSSRKCPTHTHCHNNRQSARPSACSS